MKSIRLSLMLYFLALLAVALGAVSVLAYRTADETLLAKKATARGVVEAQYRERRHKEEAKLDEALLFQAKTLARLAQFQFRFIPYRRQLSGLGPLTSVAAPGGSFTTVLWLAQATRGPVSTE